MGRDVVILKSVPGSVQNTVTQWDRAIKKNTSWSELRNQQTIPLKQGQVNFNRLPSESVGESVFLVPSLSAPNTKVKGLNVQDVHGVQAGDEHVYTGSVSWWHEYQD